MLTHDAPSDLATRRAQRLRPGVFAWVAGVHLLVFLLLALWPLLHRPRPPEQFIEMINLGEINPAAGDTPIAAAPTPSPVAPPAPAPTPPPAPATPPPRAATPPPTPTPPPPTAPTRPPTPAPTPPRTTAPTPAPKPTPTPKPATDPAPRTPVKVDLTRTVTRSTAPTSPNTSTSTNTRPAPAGPSAAEIQKRLAAQVGRTGAPDASGAGRPGSPDGNPDADAYNALIRITIERNWDKPAIPEALVTLVRLRILPDGSVQLLGLSQGSGNALMDQSVLEAIRRTPRIPQPLPPGLGSPHYDVTIRFKLH